MAKASMMDCDSIVKDIMENELGIVLLEADGNCLFDVLSEETSYKDRQGMFGNGCQITFHLYPLMYNRADVESDLIKCRADAICNIFGRWTSCGYNKHHAKNYFNCKDFNKYLDDIGFLKSDYMLLQVD
jgi:hypothetical protein